MAANSISNNSPKTQPIPERAIIPIDTQPGTPLEALRNTGEIPVECWSLRVPLNQLIEHKASPDVIIGTCERGALTVILSPNGSPVDPNKIGNMFLRVEPRQVGDFLSVVGDAAYIQLTTNSFERDIDGKKRFTQKPLIAISPGAYGSPEDRLQSTIGALEGAIDGARYGFGTSLSTIAGFRSADADAETRLRHSATPLSAQPLILFRSRLLTPLQRKDPFFLNVAGDWGERLTENGAKSVSPQSFMVEVERSHVLRSRSAELRCVADPASAMLVVTPLRGPREDAPYEKAFDNHTQLSSYLLGFVEGYLAARLMGGSPTRERRAKGS